VIAQPLVIEGRQAAVESARRLAPGIRARANQAEAERRLPQASIDELLDSGLFGVLKPRKFGGLECGIESLVEITAELAAACGSTGWVYGVLAGHSWLMNLFPEQAQQEVFADPHALTATVFRFSGQLERVDGGFRLTNGTGRFCSGIDHASWVIVGNAVVGEGVAPEPRFLVVPKKNVEVADDWFTVGMRGTGSRTIKIADAFIPEHRSVRIDALSAGTSPGATIHRAPLYRTPFQLVAPFSIVGVPLGIAHRALDVYAEGLDWIAGLGDGEQSTKSATLARLAAAAAQIDAARALVLADARMIDTLMHPEALDPIEKARLPRNWAHAAQTTRDAVSLLFSASGGSAIYDDSEIQRLWRDINSAAQHYGFTWDNAMSDYGRVLIGLPPLHTIPGKRR
jgi:3-hydroxy-9,10-secoandrosta-1,3,5(10)-triene-9,17-dione monooxygenase